MLVLDAANAGEVWADVWSSITTRGLHRKHGRGNYLEAPHSVLRISDPRRRWATTRQPSINPAFALAEVIWIMRGRNDTAFLTSWNRSLSNFIGNQDVAYGAYGERVRSRFGFDQLERAASALSASPEQRQVVLQIWDARTDMPFHDGQSQNADIPCNVTSILKVADGKLEWMQVMRSNDAILGLPYNLVQWTTVQEILAGWMSLDLGSYVHVADSLHIYERDLDRFGPGEPTAFETTTDLRLPKHRSDTVFETLERVVEEISNDRDRDSILRAIGEVQEVAYVDWIRVMAAERLRRIGEPQEGIGLSESIVDDQLRRASLDWHRQRSLP